MSTPDLSTKGKRLKHFIELKFSDPKKKNPKSGALTRAAKALDMKPQNLSKYTSDLRDPSGELIRRFQEKLRINPNWYLTGEGDMETPDPGPDMQGFPEGSMPASILLQLPVFDVTTPEGAQAYSEWFDAAMQRAAELGAEKALEKLRREERGDG